MILAGPDICVKQAKDTKRAQTAVTFEVIPHLFGFNEKVILRSLRIDYARNIVHFYFGGDGLEEIEQTQHVNLTSYEGQECPEIIPPAWKVEL